MPDKDLEVEKQELVADFPKFSDYPAPVQEAMLDMAFNLGGHALKANWPKLTSITDEK